MKEARSPIADLPAGQNSGLLAPRRPGPRERAAIATRIKLVLAAETLFGEKGVEAVSLREIAGAAGQANSNATQYHFGDKDMLIQAIFEYRGLQFEPLRMAMLERLERENRLLDVKGLMQILCLPYLSAKNAEGRYSYAAFLSQYLTKLRSGGVQHPFAKSGIAPAYDRLFLLLGQRLNYLAPELPVRRAAMASLAFCGMLMRWESTGPGETTLTLRQLVLDTLEQITAAVSASAAYEDANLFPIDV